MTDRKTNPLVHLLPSLTDMAFLMPIVFLFARMQGAKTMLGDGDTGWHIRTGEWILANGRVPRQDIFSFTKAGQPWFAWEWLWDAGFAWLYHHGGLATVVLVNIIFICLAFALLFRLLRRHCPNPFLAMAVTFVACAASSIHWLARPHLITILFVLILMFVLDRVRQGHRRLLCALPLFTILWTNLHGGFFVELIILGAYTAGEIAAAFFAVEPGRRRELLRSARQYAITTGACALATFVNPYTYHLHQHIYQFFSEPYHMQNIAEYQSINLHEPAAMYLQTMLLLGAVAAVWFVVKRRDFVPLILVVGWGHLALFSARNIPLFSIVAAPFAAQALCEMLRSVETTPLAGWVHRCLAAFRATGDEFAETDGYWRVHAISAVAIAVLALLITDPNASAKLKPEYDPSKYPAKALAVLRSDPSSRIFADDEWGDYLLFKLYPRQKVFVDGRDDFYGQDFEQKYLEMMTIKYDWEQYLRTYKIDTIVLSPKAALCTLIKESSNWRVVYDDTVAVVFRAVRQETPYHQFSTGIPGEKKSDPKITDVSVRDNTITKMQKGV